MQTEIKDIVAVGYLNGLFVLARSIGLIGEGLLRLNVAAVCACSPQALQPAHDKYWLEVAHTTSTCEQFFLSYIESGDGTARLASASHGADSKHFSSALVKVLSGSPALKICKRANIR